MSHTATVKTVPIKSVRALNKAVEELKASGIKCDLLRDAVPRMFYKDQITKHLSTNQNYRLNGQNDVCDFVLSLPNCFYDIAFVKHRDGHYEPVFDNFVFPPASSYSGENRGTKSIKDELGLNMQGAKAQGYSSAGAMEAAEATMCSIGKFLQSYSKHAAIEAAEDAGYMVSSVDVNEKGEVVLEVEIN